MQTPIIHRKVRIKGIVQGVFYRKSMQQQALALEVAGFVQNDPDGTVYAEIEGTATAVEALLEWCWDGPEYAVVQDIAVQKGEAQGFSSFTIA